MAEIPKTGRDPVPMPPTHDDLAREAAASRRTSHVTVQELHDSAMGFSDLMLRCAKSGNLPTAIDWALEALLAEVRAVALGRQRGVSFATLGILARSASHIAQSLSDFAARSVREYAERSELPVVQREPIGQELAKLVLAYEAIQDAMAKRLLAEWNAEHRANGTPNEWPAQQTWEQLAPTSHAILWQAARREAGLDDQPSFREWLDRLTVDLQDAKVLRVKR